MQQPPQTSLQPQQMKPVNGSKPSPQPPHSSTQPPLPSASGMMTAAASAGVAYPYPTSSFSLHQSRLNSRLQAVFSASSELLLSEDANVARLYEALEQWYLVGDQSLLHLMDADALLTVYESEPYQSSLPLSLSSMLPQYHTPPAQLMTQQWQTMDKVRLRHQLLTAVSADYLPPPASPPAPDPQLPPPLVSSLTATSPSALAEQSPSMPSLSSPSLPSSPPVAAKEEERKERERERAPDINLADDEPTAQQTPVAAPQAAGDGAMELDGGLPAPERMQEARSIMDLTNS
jgi:hypothetical protein